MSLIPKIQDLADSVGGWLFYFLQMDLLCLLSQVVLKLFATKKKRKLMELIYERMDLKSGFDLPLQTKQKVDKVLNVSSQIFIINYL